MKMPISVISTVLREILEPIAVSSGAPTTTPSA